MNGNRHRCAQRRAGRWGVAVSPSDEETERRDNHVLFRDLVFGVKAPG